MKRLISILLTAIMLFTLTVPAAFAAGGVSVSVSNAQAKANDEITLYISLNNLTEGYISGKVTVSCDAGLTLTKLEGVAFNGYSFGSSVNHASAKPETGATLAKATIQVDSNVQSGDYKVYVSVQDMVTVDFTPIPVTSGVGVVTVHAHTWGDYSKDASGHWQKCSCGETSAKAPHVPGPAPTVESAQTCTICGYVIAPALPAPHEHVWGDWAAYSAVQHKRVCATDSTHIDYANHNFVDSICADCGYELIIEDPETPEDGLSAQELMLLMMMLRNHTSTITATAGEGGMITPAGATKVSFGKDQTYRIIPQPGYMIDSVVVDGKDKGAITEYTFQRVLTKHTITATFKRIPWVNPFSDVKEGDWFYNYVACANYLGLMIGTSDTTFSPEAPATRAQIVTTLWRLENKPTAENKADFTDVAEGMWYTDAIAWAAENKIVEGHGDGTFGPDDEITREQILAILHRYAAYKELAAEAEAEIPAEYTCSEWAKGNVAWAYENGLLSGIGIDIKDMTAIANRAEIAAYLSWFCLNVIAK